MPRNNWSSLFAHRLERAKGKTKKNRKKEKENEKEKRSKRTPADSHKRLSATKSSLTDAWDMYGDSNCCKLSDQIRTDQTDENRSDGSERISENEIQTPKKFQARDQSAHSILVTV